MSGNDEIHPPLHILTNDEINVIQESWKIPSANPIDSAEFIFYSLLERFPEHQPRFPAFKDKPLPSLKGKPYFRAHASRIFNVFNAIIDGLHHDPENADIKRFIADLGVSHAKRNISKRAFNEVRIVLMDIICDVCKLDDFGKVAWTKLLDIFIHVVFECIDGRVEQFNI